MSTDDTSLTIERKIHFKTGANGRRRLEEGEPPPRPKPPGRTPRLSRLMALAIRFEKLIAAGEVKKELNDRQKKRRAFWTRLLERAGEKTKLHQRISPRTGPYVAASAGTAGIRWVYAVQKSTTQFTAKRLVTKSSLTRQHF